MTEIKLLLAIIIIVTFSGILSLSYRIYEKNFFLSYIPKEFNVSKVISSQTRSEGFGPGSNETGLLIYPLPDHVYNALKQQKLVFLQNLPSNKGKARGSYPMWHETPIIVSRYWTDYMNLPDMTDYKKQKPSIVNYLNAYGFGIEIPAENIDLIDKAVTQSGNYYSDIGNAVIIIIPESKKIIFAFNG